jgi:PAS domain S-box-containing protein
VDYALYLLNPKGYIVSWNPGARRLKGYEDSEIIGEHFSRFFTPEDRAVRLPETSLREAAEHGRYESEGWRVRRDGTRFWALAVLDAIRGENGQLLGFVKITRDMTERRAAQQRLLESEARFRQLVDGVIDYAIFHLDAIGVVTTWNAGAQRIKGYEPEEIIGYVARWLQPRPSTRWWWTARFSAQARQGVRRAAVGRRIVPSALAQVTRGIPCCGLPFLATKVRFSRPWVLSPRLHNFEHPPVQN